MADIFDTIDLQNNGLQGDIFDQISPQRKLKQYTPQSMKTAELAGDLLYQGRPIAGRALQALATLQGTGEELVQKPAANFINQFLLNAPRSIAQTRGYEYPSEAQTLAGNILSKGAGVVGGLLNPLGRLGLGAARAPLNFGNLLKLAGAGAASGFAYSPSENFGDIKQRTEQAKVGGALGAAFPAVSSVISKIPVFFRNLASNIKNVKNPVAFSQRVRQELFKAKGDVGKAVERGISKAAENNPGQRIDLSDSFQNISEAMKDSSNNPGLSSAIKGIVRKIKNPEQSKLLQSLIDDPVKAKELTLKQAQDIKVAVRNSPVISSKLKQGKFANWTTGDLELLDLLDNIRVQQIEAFPSLSKVFKPYAEYMGNYNQVKGMFKPSQLLDKLRKGFGNEEIESMIKAVLPNETYSSIQGFRNTGRAVKVGAGLAGIATAEELIRRGLNTATGK